MTSLKDYIRCIIDYTKNPSEQNQKRVEEFNSKKPDSVFFEGCYFQRLQNFFENNPEDKYRGLREGDKNTWGRLLSKIFESSSELFQQLKEVSPFVNKTLVHVGYGHNFVHINLEGLERKIHREIENQDFKTNDADDYLIALPALDIDFQKMFDGAEVVWLYSGILGQETPRKADGSPKEQ